MTKPPMSRSIALPAAFLMGFLFASATLPLAALAAGEATTVPTAQSIDQVVQRGMDEFKVPGMTVAVVHQGEVVYSEGHGILETGKKGQVDEHTLFQIASVSKAFVSASLALLVDEGKLGWDDRVIDYLPEFRMYDPWVTREFTIRDLLTHRSGLPLGAGDLLLFPEAESTRAEVIHAFRYLKPAGSFRSRFDYDNLLYIVAGEVVAKVSGQSFEEFQEQRLFKPIGMEECSSTLSRAGRRADKATPHVDFTGQLEITTSKITDTSAAAGGINCSAAGMAEWMKLMLNDGKTEDGTQLISSAQMKQLVTPVTLTSPGGYVDENTGASLSAYALGWGVSTFYGQPLLSHGGGLWGMTSYIMLLPQQKLGVFISNNLMSSAPRAVANEIVDQFLLPAGSEKNPAKDPDWIAIVAAASQSRKEAGDKVVAEAQAARATDSKPSLPLEAFVGTYRDSWYGDIFIEQGEDGQLSFRSGRAATLRGPLEHFQHDTFIARWVDRLLMADSYVSFLTSPEGKVERIRMKAVSPNTDFSFDFHDLDLQRVD
jgi:CubicO group peptidase (beta-lactamase class C family)